MKKWYVGLEIKEILSEMSRIAHNCVACAKLGENSHSEELETLFTTRFKEVIPAIVEIKTAYWQFRNDNDVWNNWDKLQQDLWTIRRGMESQLVEIYVK
jgi:hypothetical protein